MPLIKKPTKKAFEHNIKAEMHSGKPQNQSLAIAYDIQRRNRKKHALGGMVEQKDIHYPELRSEMDRELASESSQINKTGTLGASRKMFAKGKIVEALMRKKYANGGQVDIDTNNDEDPNSFYDLNEHEALDYRMDEDFEDMHQPEDSNMHSDSSELDAENEHDMSMIDKIMRKRSKLK